MSEPGWIEPTPPSLTPIRVIKVWTPKNIFWLGIFLGWPTALALCIINWFRMGLWKKAVIFIGGGLVGLILFFGASFKLPENASSFPFLVLNLLLLVSFQSLMKIDITSSVYPNVRFKKAGIGWGILVGILTLGVIFGSLVIIFVLLDLLNIFQVPNPTIPFPGKESLKDIQMAALAWLSG